MGTGKSGRYLNTRGSGRSVSDYALVHSNEGTFTYSPKTGKISKLKSGGHGQEGMDILKKQGITYNVVIRRAGEHVAGLKKNRHVSSGKPIYGVYKGVRVGVIRTNGKIATVFPDSDQSSVLRRKR